MDTPKTWRRRGRRPTPNPTLACSLAGCPRPRSSSHNYCSMLCASVHKAVYRAQTMTEVIGPSALNAASTELADAVARYQSAYEQVHQAAVSVGITHEQWSRIAEHK